MGQHDATKEKIFKSPTCANLKWNELESFLISLGYIKQEGKGSRVKFKHAENVSIINLHKPHPGNLVKKYIVEQLREKLEWIRN